MMKLALVGLVLALMPMGASAQGMRDTQGTSVYQMDGRDPVYASISCTSSAWTQVASSDTIRRSLLIQSLSSNGSNICLGTSTNGNNDACNSSHAGIELATSATYTSLTREKVVCRSYQGSPVLKVKAARDRGDYGRIANGIQN